MERVFEEFERMWKEMVFDYFKLLYHYFPELTEINHE
jgi:hypothetical protein